MSNAAITHRLSVPLAHSISFYLMDGHTDCGDQTIDSRFQQRVGQVDGSILASQNVDLRFGDFKCCNLSMGR